eukprot:COSAG01_NODE_11928_length_1834_cov_1.332565_2_plen_298_part_00
MLTAAQVAAYHRDGVVILRDWLEPSTVDLMLRTAKADTRFTDAGRDVTDQEGLSTRLAIRMWELPEDTYSAFCRHERVVRPIEQLLGSPVFHYHHKMMLKEPRVGGAWEWHQDYGYWYSNFLHDRLASCMIAVDRATRENGCLQVLQGSHRAGRIEHLQVGTKADQTGASLERVALLQQALPVVHCEMEPGSALFFHSNLLHRSAANTSEFSRWSLICCYGAVDNPPIGDMRLKSDAVDRGRSTGIRQVARESRGLSESEKALGRVETWSQAQVAAAGRAHWQWLQEQQLSTRGSKL